MQCKECDKKLGYFRNNGTEWVCRACGKVTNVEEDKE